MSNAIDAVSGASGSKLVGRLMANTMLDVMMQMMQAAGVQPSQGTQGALQELRNLINGNLKQACGQCAPPSDDLEDGLQGLGGPQGPGQAGGLDGNDLNQMVGGLLQMLNGVMQLLAQLLKAMQGEGAQGQGGGGGGGGGGGDGGFQPSPQAGSFGNSLPQPAGGPLEGGGHAGPSTGGAGGPSPAGPSPTAGSPAPTAGSPAPGNVTADPGKGPSGMPPELWQGCVEAGKKTGVDPYVLAAQMEKESQYGKALAGSPSAGDGLMQVEPATRQAYAGKFQEKMGHAYDHNNQKDQIAMAGVILASKGGDTKNMLQKYNGGDNWAPGATDSYGRVIKADEYASTVLSRAQEMKGAAV